jgi:hypothetical protein
MTRNEAHEALARCATQTEVEEIVALRRALAAPGDEIAWEVAGTRRYWEILFRDLKEWIKTQFDGTNARIDAIHRRLK